MGNIIEIKHLTKKIENQLILSDINLCFEEEHIYGIVGRNGSGKTVLLKCICGLMEVTQGEVIFNGKRLKKDMEYIDQLGFLIERPGFLEKLSAYENLRYIASIKRIAGKKEIEESLRKVNLDPCDKKKVGKYSLGMKQRLGIAQAFMENPEILILDDSSSALDYKTDSQLRKTLSRLLPDTTKIIVAQRISSVKNSDHILVLEGGRMLGYGTHEELLASCGEYKSIFDLQMGGLSNEK